VFGITGPSDDARLEPVLCGRAEIAVTPFEEGRKQPTISLVTPAKAGAHGWMGAGRSLPSGGPGAGPGGRDDKKDAPQSPDPLDREPKVNERRGWRRLRGPVGSLLLHLLPLLLLMDWQTPPPA
jgi:hypothetical protein